MKTDNHHNDILSLVTHDLKSPMTAVMGALDFLSLDDLTKKEKEQSIKSARKASKSILKIIENILIMAKYEAGNLKIKVSKIDNLSEHFLDMKQTFKYEAKVKNIDFNFIIPEKLPIVYWDIDTLHYHCINNILSNAIKFTDENGTITFEVKVKEEYIVIIIKDDGIGIKKDKRKTIFEKYDTHDNQKVFKGTGLGLYNAHNFIKQHNGTIEVTNGINQKGIGFKIKLPIKYRDNNL
ncbi:MAG: HAMP domain-containing sensor histidine kinase [Campylobacterota bacterium]|nr:HAMP domain-containing sensor histidine kinase [Campylobacterota bacterium]